MSAGGGAGGDAGRGPDAPADPRACGERIEQLLEASAAAGPLARERAEELVRCVVDLYGAGLQRVLEIAHAEGALTGPVLDGLAADELVASLLLVHGLHPYPLAERVARALDGVRPYLGSHGGDVELLGIDEAGTVQLRMLGSCDGCPSSAATLTLAVRGAIEAAAPEVTGVQVQEQPRAASGVIPPESLRARLPDPAAPAGAGTGAGTDAGAPAWVPLGELAAGPEAGVRAGTVAGVAVVVCRIGEDLFAYRDGCPGCGAALGAAVLGRVLAAPAGTVALSCPACRRHFDVRRAGRGIDGAEHLAPLPVLRRPGGWQVALVPEQVPA